jgi:hypothetical protein
MNKIGMICDLSYSRHHLFKSYYKSISNIFGTKPKLIRTLDDLYGIKLLFIGDDHYGPHKVIWQQLDFIAYCNINQITVVVFTNEKILNSYFPWNAQDLQLLNRFKKLYHYTIDVEDCIKLGLKLNRTAMSIDFQEIIPEIEKKDKVVFIGKVDCMKDSYRDRKNLLPELKKVLDLDIYESNIPTWEEYLKIIAGYRFVLSPLGNGNFFPMRFYEALAVKSIPIHQILDNTLDLYNIESNFDDCIFFRNISELQEKLSFFNHNVFYKESTNVIWMEDNIIELLKSDNII